jgi:ribonuclease P protein subunit RPR2
MVVWIKKAIKDLAQQRAKILYRLSLSEAREGNISRARHYIEIALTLIRKANANKPMYLRRGICKNCLAPLIPGVTARIRIRHNRKYVIITKTCLLCGWVRRIPCKKIKARNE